MALKDKLNSFLNNDPPKSKFQEQLSNFEIPNEVTRSGPSDIRQGTKSQYDQGFNPMYNDQNLFRATRQPSTHKFANAVIGGLSSGVMTAIEDVGYIMDWENNFNRIAGIENVESNFVSDWAKNNKEALMESLPIYRKRPNQIFDWKDSGFYWEAFRGMLDSAVGFGAVGMGAAGVVKGLGAGIRMASQTGRVNRLKAVTDMFGKSLQTGELGNISAALITNFGEGKLMGLELYETSYDLVLEELSNKFKEDNGQDFIPESKLEEFQREASRIAGDKANDFIMNNRAFMFTDYLQIKSIFKASPTLTRNQIPKPKTGLAGGWQFLKSQAATAPKEYLEEVGQNVLQMEGEFQTDEALRELGIDVKNPVSTKQDWGERFLEFATSDQAQLEGLMGLFSGPIQYAVTTAPFQNKEARLKQYSDQETTKQRNRDFFKNKVLATANRAKAIEEAMAAGEVKVAEAIKLQEFDNLAIENFARGTTDNLESVLRDELESDEYTDVEKQSIQEKLDRLISMEEEYIKFKDYSNSTGIYENRLRKRHVEDFIKLSNDRVSELTAEIQNDYTGIINAYNKKAGEDNQISFSDVLQAINSNDFKGIPNELKKLLVEDDNVGRAISFIRGKDGKEGIIGLENKLSTLQSEFNNMKDSRYNLGYSILTSIMNNQMMNTDDKIEQLNKLQENTKGLPKIFQDQLNTQKQTLEEFVRLSKEAQQKIDNPPATKKAEVGIKNSEKKPDPVIPLTSEQEFESKLDDEQKRDLETIRGGLKLLEIDNDVLPQDRRANDMSLLELSQLTPEEQDRARQASEDFQSLPDEDKVPIMDLFADDIEVTPTVTNKSETITQISEQQDEFTVDDEIETFNYNNVTSEVNDELLETEGGLENINSNVGAKVAIYGSQEYYDWLVNGQDKTGHPVIYKINFTNPLAKSKAAIKLYNKYKADKNSITDEEKLQMIDDLPISFESLENPKIYAFLYTPSRFDGGNALISERQLRSQIIDAIIAGVVPEGNIEGQYGGNLKVVEENTSIKEIPDFVNLTNSQIPLWYVNSDGLLKDSKTREFINHPNKRFNKLKVMLKSTGRPMTGALATVVKKANGAEFPLILNINNLNPTEIKIVGNILYDLIKPSTGEINTLDRKISDKILALIPEVDRAFFGNKLSYKEVLNFYVYEGKRSTSNPATQLYFENGIVYFGKDKLDAKNFLENKDKLTEFLTTFKTRNVDLKRLQTDDAYREHIFNSGVITTNTNVSGDTLFETLDTLAMKDRYPDSMDGGKAAAIEERTKNRFRTGSVYVKNSINNPVNQTTATEVQSTPTVTKTKPVDNVEAKKADIERKIQEVTNNKNFIKLSKDGTHYVNTKTGKKYKRVSDFISDDKPDPNNKLIQSSLIIGTKVDELVRDFFANQLKDLSEYDVSSLAEIENFLEQLKSVKNNLQKRSETVLANDIVLYNDELGVAGTVDLLTYDTQGNIRIYDMKTMRGNNFTESYGDGVNKYETTKYGKSKKQKHTEQISLYRILLNNTHGLKTKTIGVMPIEISYNAGDVKTTKLNLLNGVKLTALNKVKTAELKSLESEINPIKPELNTTAIVDSVNVEAEKNKNKMDNIPILKKARRGSSGLNLDAVNENNSKVSNQTAKEVESNKDKNNKNKKC